MNASLQTLDVRPTLRAGGEPFQEIMQAVASLDSGQGLRLLATFRPVPLFKVMQNKGYAHSERPLDGGDWEVIFTPDAASAPADASTAWPTTPPATPPAPKSAPASAAKPGQADARDWPAPSHRLDNRGLMPPEPMVRTLEAIEGMACGEVLEIWNDRDPVLLYPELEARGHLAHCEMRGAEGYRVLIRRDAARQGAAS